MEIKLSKLLEIQKVAPELLAIKWPAREGFKLLKFTKQANTSLALFETKKHELFLKHGKAEGDQIKVRAADVKAFTKDLDELLAVSEPFELEQLKLPESAEVSVALLQACSDFIVE